MIYVRVASVFGSDQRKGTENEAATKQKKKQIITGKMSRKETMTGTTTDEAISVTDCPAL